MRSLKCGVKVTGFIDLCKGKTYYRTIGFYAYNIASRRAMQLAESVENFCYILIKFVGERGQWEV